MASFFAPVGGSAEGAGGFLLPFPRSGARALLKAMHKCALRDFLLPFGGLGAQPPGICADGAVASPRRKNPHKKSRAKPDFSFQGKRAKRAFLCQKKLRQRAGVFRPSGEDLCVIRFKRNHFCLVLFDCLFACLDAVSNAAGEAEGRTDHVRVGSA